MQHAKFKGINLIVGSHTFTEVFGVESLVLKLKERDNSIEITRLNEDHLSEEITSHYHKWNELYDGILKEAVEMK